MAQDVDTFIDNLRFRQRFCPAPANDLMPPMDQWTKEHWQRWQHFQMRLGWLQLHAARQAHKSARWRCENRHMIARPEDLH